MTNDATDATKAFLAHADTNTGSRVTQPASKNQVVEIRDQYLKFVLNYDLNYQNKNWDRMPLQDITYSDMQNLEYIGYESGRFDFDTSFSSGYFLTDVQTWLAHLKLNKAETSRLFCIAQSAWEDGISDISPLTYLNENKVKVLNLSTCSIINFEPIRKLIDNRKIKVGIGMQGVYQDAAPVERQGNYIFDVSDVQKVRGPHGEQAQVNIRALHSEHPNAVYNANTQTVTIPVSDNVIQKGQFCISYNLLNVPVFTGLSGKEYDTSKISITGNLVWDQDTLKKVVTQQNFKFLGLGDYEFANLDIVKGS